MSECELFTAGNICNILTSLKTGVLELHPIILGSPVSTQYWRVMDRERDRQSDRHCKDHNIQSITLVKTECNSTR